MTNHRTWCRAGRCAGNCSINIVQELPFPDTRPDSMTDVTVTLTTDRFTHTDTIALRFADDFKNTVTINIPRKNALALAYAIHAADYTANGQTTLAAHFVNIAHDCVTE